MTNALRNMLFVTLVSLLCSCGGGGGGGGESAADGSSGSLKRGVSTAVRLIHADVESSPINLKTSSIIQSAKFAQEVFYQQINSGPIVFSLEQLNGNTVTTIPADLQRDTEYTILISRNSSQGNPVYRLITDNMQRPGSGFHYVNVIHALNQTGNISVSVGAVNFESQSKNSVSSFLLVPSGSAELVVKNSSGGVMSQKTLTLEDQGETTIVISGDASLGFVTVREYKDLD